MEQGKATEEKLVIFRSEGGRFIDMVLSVENFDARFHGAAVDAMYEWCGTEDEFCDFVIDRLTEKGYKVKPVECHEINDD